MIKKYYVNGPKDGFPYDRKVNKYFSWGYDIWLNRTRKEERGFLTKQDAEDTVNALKKAAKNTRNGLAPTSKSPLLKELLDAKLNTLSGSEKNRAKRIFEDFLKIVPARVRVVDFKRAYLRAYEAKRTSDGVIKATIRREFVPIVAALNAAGDFFDTLEEYRPPKIPWPRVPRMRKSKTINVDERIAILTSLLSPRTLLEKWEYQYQARRRVGLFLQFCLLTVSRPGEVAKLKRTDVDFAAGIVTITGAKTRYLQENPVRYIKITRTMEAILKERFGKSSGPYLFTKGGKITHRMYECMKAACVDNNIEYGRGKMDGITFQTARHTGTTELSRRVDTKTAGAFTGHSDETMTLYYTHTNSKLLDLAGEVLEETMGMNLYSSEFLESVQEK